MWCLCNMPGHEARNCLNKCQQAVEAIEDAQRPVQPRVATVFAITEKPHVQQPQLGDMIRAAPARQTATRNRFQPLGLGVWQEIAADVAREKPTGFYVHLRGLDP